MNTKKPPLERRIVVKTMSLLNSRGGFWLKVHGSPFQVGGIPDIIGCYRGRFVAFEVKRDETKEPTKLQQYWLKKIKAAGGIARVIWHPSHALAILDKIDAGRSARAASDGSPTAGEPAD